MASDLGLHSFPMSDKKDARLIWVKRYYFVGPDKNASAAYILCTISLAISYVSHLFCAHLCVVPINFICNDENRILGK